MYQQKQNGGFRMRASFPITPKQIMGLNVICQKTGLSFSKVCSIAVDKMVSDYVSEGVFCHPDLAAAVCAPDVDSAA